MQQSKLFNAARVPSVGLGLRNEDYAVGWDGRALRSDSAFSATSTMYALPSVPGAFTLR